MAQICCCNTGNPTIESVTRSLDRLDNSINSSGTGSAGLGQDPSCECDPCTCPSDTVPCNANVLEDDLSNQGLLKKLSGLVRQARQLQAAQGDGCVCADRPPPVKQPGPIKQPGPVRQPPGQQPTGQRQPPKQTPPQQTPPQQTPPQKAPARSYVSRGLQFFDLPLEIRRHIYRYCFEDLGPVRTIAAARFRQGPRGQQETRTRLWRNYHPLDRPYRRRIDPARLTEGRPLEAGGNEDVPDWLRETAVFTYESAATDEELQQLPDVRLGLILTHNRRLSEEASEVFYGQNFHFTLHRQINTIPADEGIFQSILAAEAFFRHRRVSREHIRQLEFDMWQDPQFDDETSSNEVMRPRQPERRNHGDDRLMWTDGLDRLGSLATTLNGLPNFRHLRLNFRNLAPPWHTRQIYVSGQTSD